MKRIRPHVYVAENNVGICQFYDLPKCDFCGAPARYDGETIHRGRAAYMCEQCFQRHARKPFVWLTILEKLPKIEYHSDKVPVITIPLTLETTYWDVYVLCPHCAACFKHVELDAEGVVSCDCCGNQYQLRSELNDPKTLIETGEAGEDKYADDTPRWLEEFFEEIMGLEFGQSSDEKQKRKV